MLRIELIEKVVLDEDIDYEYYENLKIDPPKPKSYFRRTYPLFDMIERHMEIPGNDKECIVQFMSGERIIVKGNYDDFCIKINDIEQQMIMDEEE